jgi:hypothetical protein
MCIGCCSCRGAEGEAAVDGVKGVDIEAENSIGFVVEGAGDAGERYERGFVAVGAVDSIIQW